MTGNKRSRNAIVTGSTNGIGLAIAQQLLEAGHNVVINGRREKMLHQIESELSGQHQGRVASVLGDSSEPKVIQSLFQCCEDRFNRAADIVVANAGRGLKGSPSSADLSEFADVIKTNLTGTAFLLQETSRRFQEIAQSSPPLELPLDIVILGSTVGRNLSPFSAMYGSTKFAIHAVAEALRRELGPKGIRVSLIEPGIVETGFQEAAKYDSTMLKNFTEKFGPLLKPSDVADTVSFLLSLPPHVHVNEIMIRPTRQDYP